MGRFWSSWGQQHLPPAGGAGEVAHQEAVPDRWLELCWGSEQLEPHPLAMCSQVRQLQRHLLPGREKLVQPLAEAATQREKAVLPPCAAAPATPRGAALGPFSKGDTSHAGCRAWTPEASYRQKSHNPRPAQPKTCRPGLVAKRTPQPIGRSPRRTPAPILALRGAFPAACTEPRLGAAAAAVRKDQPTDSGRVLPVAAPAETAQPCLPCLSLQAAMRSANTAKCML